MLEDGRAGCGNLIDIHHGGFGSTNSGAAAFFNSLGSEVLGLRAVGCVLGFDNWISLLLEYPGFWPPWAHVSLLTGAMCRKLNTGVGRE